MGIRQSVKDAIQQEVKAAQTIGQRAIDEDRSLTVEEQTEVTQRLKNARELNDQAKADADVRKQLADISTEVGGQDPEPDKKQRSNDAPPNGRKSVGQMYVESAEYKDLIASAPGGHFSEKTAIHSKVYGVKALITGASDTSGGALVTPDRYGLLDPTYERPLTVRQLVTNGTTGSDAIEYVQLVSTTNAAAPVGEATTHAAPTQNQTTGNLIRAAGGGYKPESAMTFEKKVTNVGTIAHWMPATKRSLSDVAQMMTLIDNFLGYGLEEELEGQIIEGDGSGDNFLGIESTSGIQSQAYPTVVAPAEVGILDLLDSLHVARRKVRTVGRAIPTAYVMNPIDWERFELARDGMGRYQGNGPFGTTPNQLWGLPVVESEAVQEGVVYVADWRQAVLWDRERASIQVTTSHEDFFIRNLVAILAEMRAAFAVLRPAAFVRAVVTEAAAP